MFINRLTLWPVTKGTAWCVALMVSLAILMLRPTPASAAPLTAGTSTRIINLICQFPDQPTSPGTPAEVQKLFLNNPGYDLNGYIEEMSFGAVNLQGTQTAPKIYTLQPLANYGPAGNPDKTQVMEACTAAADPDVNFSQFNLVMIFTNGFFTGEAGSVNWFTPRYDGATSNFTILLGADGAYSPAMIAHELGHMYGMGMHPYSVGWDPMASANLGTAGCAIAPGPGYNALSRLAMGWVPAARILEWNGTPQSVTLARLSQPSANGYLLVKIPAPRQGGFYYLEFRGRNSVYETPLTRLMPGSTCSNPNRTNFVGGGQVLLQYWKGEWQHPPSLIAANNPNPGGGWNAGQVYPNYYENIFVSIVSTSDNEAVIHISSQAPGETPTPIPTATLTPVPPIGATPTPTPLAGNTWVNDLNGTTTLRPQDLGEFCLNLDYNWGNNGAKINLWRCNGHNSQKWVRNSDGTIRPKDYPNFCLNLDYNLGQDNATINLWQCNGHNSQKWNADANHNLHPQDYPDFCLNVDYNLGANGTPINLWQCNGHNSQKWNVAAPDVVAAAIDAISFDEIRLIDSPTPLPATPALESAAPPPQKLFLPIITLAGTAFGEEINPMLLVVGGLLLVGGFLLFWFRRIPRR